MDQGTLEFMEELEKLKFVTSYSIHVSYLLIMVGTGFLYALWLKPFLKKTYLGVISGILYSVIAIVFYFTFLDISNYIIYGLAGGLGLLVIYFGERRNFRQKLFLCTIFFAVRLTAVSVSIEIYAFLSDLAMIGMRMQSDIPLIIFEFCLEQLAYVLINLGMLYAAVRLFHKVFWRKQENILWREVGILLAPALPVMLSRHLKLQYHTLWNQGISNGTITENMPGNAIWLLFYLASYAVILIVVYFYQDYKNRAEGQKEMLLIRAQQENIKAHIGQVERLYEQQRSFKHDVGNHIQTLEHLIAYGDKADAAEYLERLKSEWGENIPEIRTGNPVTDVIFMEKKQKAESVGIRFEADFHFPEKSGINAYDISILLNNALDNSLENANGPEPYIKVSSFRKKSVFMIVVKNSYEGDLAFDRESGLPETNKSGDDHGLGLKNIRRIAGMYYGDISLAQAEGEVILTIMLQTQ